MTTDTDRVATRIVVHGRVQGVWYRGWTVDQARARGLTGWVRNRRDGTVEALLIGLNSVVRDMIDECRSGPVAARVIGIEEYAVSAEEVPGEPFHGFDQRPTE
ncbi:MAG: acylphosphatase [Alphaproteobacteria bacterium]|jgi:acylphosphatase